MDVTPCGYANVSATECAYVLGKYALAQTGSIRHEIRSAQGNGPGRRGLANMNRIATPVASSGQPAIKKLAGDSPLNIAPGLDTDVSAFQWVLAVEGISYKGIFVSAIAINVSRSPGRVQYRGGIAQQEVATGFNLNITGTGSDLNLVADHQIVTCLQLIRPGIACLQHVPDRHDLTSPQQGGQVNACFIVRPEAITQGAIQRQITPGNQTQRAGASTITPVN